MVPELKLEEVRFRVWRGTELRVEGEARQASLRRDSTELEATDLLAVLPRGAEPVRIRTPRGQGSSRAGSSPPRAASRWSGAPTWPGPPVRATSRSAREAAASPARRGWWWRGAATDLQGTGFVVRPGHRRARRPRQPAAGGRPPGGSVIVAGIASAALAAARLGLPPRPAPRPRPARRIRAGARGRGRGALRLPAPRGDLHREAGDAHPRGRPAHLRAPRREERRGRRDRLRHLPGRRPLPARRAGGHLRPGHLRERRRPGDLRRQRGAP